MPQRHLGSVEVEEVHKLDGLSLAESPVVHASRLIIELEVDRKYFDMFCAFELQL
jgi:hypothetical protein